MTTLHNPTKFGGVVLVGKALGAEGIAAAALDKGKFAEFNATSGKVELAEAQDVGRKVVVLGDAAADQPCYYGTGGVLEVLADNTLDEGQRVKVGVSGRANKFSPSAITVDSSVTGAASAVTQPGAATTLEILQAADVAGDRGRSVRIVGGDASGNVIYEDIALDSSDTTTVVAGSVSFTSIAGAYMADGAVAGAQNITVREADDTGVLTISGASAGTGFEVPAGTTDVTASIVTVTGPNSDTTKVTLFGVLDEDGTLGGQRLTLDGSSPSAVSTTVKMKTVTHILTGEATNAGSFSVATTADTAYMEQGIVIKAATEGNLAEVVLV